MNIEHLKKQAKNFTTLYPALVAEFPMSSPLHASQEVVAKLSGYPSWHAVAGNSRQDAANGHPASLDAAIATALAATRELAAFPLPDREWVDAAYDFLAVRAPGKESA